MIQASRTPKIIVSYRRSESGTAGRIFDRLVAHFGANSVFIDVDNIPYGVDFRKHIGEALEASDLLLAIVGNSWLGPIAEGKYRIAEETDPVRVEIETALERDISLLPVLVDDAKMPAADALPDSIKAFAYRNAAEVVSGRDFHFHVDRLIRSIDGILAGKLSSVPSEAAAANASTAKGFRRIFAPRNLVLGLAALAVAALVAVVFSGGGRLSLESGDSNYALEASRSSGQPTFDPALTAWNAAKDTESVSVLEGFIARFGESFYTELAKAKLAELKKTEEKKVAVATPPEPVATPPKPVEPAVGVFPKPGAEGGEKATAEDILGSIRDNVRQALRNSRIGYSNLALNPASHSISVKIRDPGNVDKAVAALRKLQGAGGESLDIARTGDAGIALTVTAAVVPPTPVTPSKSVEPAVGVFPKPEAETEHKPGDTFKDCDPCPETA